jgi:hypothetical protein
MSNTISLEDGREQFLQGSQRRAEVPHLVATGVARENNLARDVREMVEQVKL